MFMVYQLSRITSFLPNLFGFKFNTCQIYYSSLVLFSNSLSKGWVSRQKNSRNSRNRSSCLEFHVKQDVPKNYAKSTGKHQRQSPFFTKLQVSLCNFITKETLAQVLSCEFCKIFMNAFFMEHFLFLWNTSFFRKLNPQNLNHQSLRFLNIMEIQKVFVFPAKSSALCFNERNPSHCIRK